MATCVQVQKDSNRRAVCRSQAPALPAVWRVVCWKLTVSFEAIFFLKKNQITYGAVGMDQISSFCLR